jgi:hypothetical protein
MFLKDINIRKGKDGKNPHFQQVKFDFESDSEALKELFWEILWKV